MTNKEILVSSRELLSNPCHWTQHAEARNNRGLTVSPTDIDAVCWCALGALKFCLKDAYLSEVVRDIEIHGLDGESLTNFNDNPYTNHKNVLDAFDKTIKAIREETKQ